MSAGIDRKIDELYQLPLDEFTSARNLLAKQGGAESAGIRRLQKPPVAAWAVNQVYWRRRPVYDALVEASATARAAHAAVLSGKRADLRSAGKDHEEAIEAALVAAVDLLQQSGHAVTDATRHAIATTLRGLPADDPPGKLTRVLQPGGFEMLAGIPLRAAPPASKKGSQDARTVPARRQPADEPKKEPTGDSQAVVRARDAATAATRALKIAEQAARREEFEAARAARDVEKAARARDGARAELDAARLALDAAEREVSAAERRRATAERRVRDTEEAIAAARTRAAEADKALAGLLRKR